MTNNTDPVRALHSAAEQLLSTLAQHGEWDDGCYYYGGRAASELQGPIRELEAALASAPPSAPVGVGLLCRVYADAYHAGHYATVEGGYIDVLPADRDTYWRDQIESDYPEALAQQPAAPSGEAVGITPEWVIGYFPSDVDQETQDTVRGAFAEWVALRAAPQQPAGVDEAMVRVPRGAAEVAAAVAVEWTEMFAGIPGLEKYERYHYGPAVEQMRDDMTAALAAQQQEPTT